MPIIPNLPIGAMEELPDGTTKLKNTRGTLAWWVIVSLSAISIFALYAAYNTVQNENKELKQTNKDLTNEVRQLQQDEIDMYKVQLDIQMKVLKAEHKIDSL